MRSACFLFSTVIAAVLISGSVMAQTTEFTFQGSLKDGASAANGNYDFEFALFDALSGGAQLGSTLTRSTVAVSNGIFAVQLDFGSQFTGANRFLEIRLRPAGNPGGYQQLLPRQAVNSAPYSVRSLNSTTSDIATNATQLGGVAANQFVVTTDPRMTDSRSPTAGSGSYIQNQNAGTQATSNFNISGSGTAGGTLSGGVVNSATEYRIGGNRILGNAGTGNTFAGIGAGALNSTGINNTFAGTSAGQANTSGLDNSFFGRSAGSSNTTGGGNSFFGVLAGGSNSSGGSNSFFGGNAGNSNTTGHDNSFFGAYAGQLTTAGQGNLFVGSNAGPSNTFGNYNSFVGMYAGFSSTNGDQNTFVGHTAGSANVSGFNNTAIGFDANVIAGNMDFATAIGSGSLASLSNSIYLGRSNGSDTVRVPGNLNVTGNTSLNGNLTFASGGVASISSANLFMTLLPAGTGTTLCRTASNQVVTCSSSLRYKTNIKRFGFGLDLIGRLKPITFDWKEDGTHDFGLGAEDVAAIEPLLVTYNDKGEVEGVKYDRLGVVLVNAIKEQQKTIETQQRQIDAMKKFICLTNKDAEFCRE